MSNTNKFEPKKCANCGATLDINQSKETTVCPYCRASFNTSELLGESDELKIEKMKTEAYKDIESKKLQHEIDKENKEEKQKELDNFKKSKLKKWLVPCSIISGICTLGCFSSGDTLAGFIALVQMAAYITALLMGYQVVKEKFKYMRILIAIVGFILIIPFCSAFGNDSSSTTQKAESFNWSNLTLHNKLPQPKSTKGIIHVDSKDNLSIELENTSTEDFKAYISKCKKLGYTNDEDSSTSTYSAYNKQGYQVRLSHIDIYNQLSISLDAPMKLSNIEWPDNDLVKMLPKPKSMYGNISSDSSDNFEVYIGKTSKSDFNAYVKACKDKGFDKNYTKEDKYYEAIYKDKYELTINLNYNIMKISIEILEGKEESDDIEKSENKNNSENKDSSNKNESTNKESNKKKDKASLVDPKFKKTMDAYEEFFDEYIEFMDKYEKNSTDLSLMQDYTDYMKKYSETLKKLEEIDEDKLSPADYAYYVKVNARIQKKLADSVE